MDDNLVGRRIRERRKFKGLTQEELADKVGISVMSIRRYESGERNVPERTLQKMANILDVEMSYFYTLDDEASFRYAIITLIDYLGQYPAEETTLASALKNKAKRNNSEIAKTIKTVASKMDMEKERMIQMTQKVLRLFYSLPKEEQEEIMMLMEIKANRNIKKN